MKIGSMHSKARLTLLATMVAAASTLVAVPAQAGKAPPAFQGVPSITCEAPGGHTVVDFPIEGKGKWVFLDVVAIVDGNRNQVRDGERFELTDAVYDDNFGRGVNVAIEATLVDRKGVPFGTTNSTVTTTDVDCPEG